MDILFSTNLMLIMIVVISCNKTLLQALIFNAPCSINLLPFVNKAILFMLLITILYTQQRC